MYHCVLYVFTFVHRTYWKKYKISHICNVVQVQIQLNWRKNWYVCKLLIYCHLIQKLVITDYSFQIDSLDPEELCPPGSNGEFQEMMMWLLCGLLLILIILVLLNLAHSAHKYRTRGQLPWLALKMHWV